MDGSHCGSFFPCGRAPIGKGAGCHCVVKELRRFIARLLLGPSLRARNLKVYVWPNAEDLADN